MELLADGRLRDAETIADIQEGDGAMQPDGMDPTCDGDMFALFACAKLSAIVCSVHMSRGPGGAI
jgi:hypothetical protein